MPGNPLEYIRIKRGWSKYRMAKTIGCSGSSYELLIRSNRTSFARLSQIAKALGLTDSELRAIIESWEAEVS